MNKFDSKRHASPIPHPQKRQKLSADADHADADDLLELDVIADDVDVVSTFHFFRWFHDAQQIR